jgi:hypothetical protein
MSHYVNRRAWLLGLLGTSALGAAGNRAFSASGLPWTQAAGPLELDVVDRESGAPLHLHAHRGRRYIVGEPGREFGLRLRNRGNERVLAVTSVDGLNVLDGGLAAVGGRGYVLEPWQTVVIDGWRKSLDDVAAFYFTALRDSYAGRTGRPANVGVIGVAVFHERPRAWLQDAESQRAEEPARGEGSPSDASADTHAPPPPPSSSRSSSSTAAENAAEGRAQPGDRSREALSSRRLGTGHGRRVESRVQTVAFERASDRPNQVLRIDYDSETRLVALGVLRPAYATRRAPNPFPAGFVPDP